MKHLLFHFFSYFEVCFDSLHEKENGLNLIDGLVYRLGYYCVSFFFFGLLFYELDLAL